MKKESPNRSRRFTIGLISGLLLLCLATSGLVIGAQMHAETPLTERRDVVPAAGAEAAEVDIEMPAGMLDLGSSAGPLLQANFRYSDPEATPRLIYDLQETYGALLVAQPELEQSGLRRAVNRWRLRLDRQRPLDLKVRVGDGVHVLDLRGLILRDALIAFPTGGIVSVNLAGYWEEGLDLTLQGGPGLLVVSLPQSMATRVEIEGDRGRIEAEGLTRTGDGVIFVNDASGALPLLVRIVDHSGEIKLKNGLPGDMPAREAIRLARLVYSKDGAFNCEARPDDGRYLSTDTVNDLWYDYLCERGPERRTFDGDDPLTQELAAAELVDRIRRDYYWTETDVVSGTMKFNAEEFMSATLDMLLKARTHPDKVEFSLTHFMGSFTYSVRRVGDRLHYTVANQTDLASGTHLPFRFPDAGYTQNLEELLAQEPELGDAFLLELVQSNRYPIISVLGAKRREETRESLGEGGGALQQTFTWSERYLADFAQLPPWPEYIRRLEIR